MSTDTNDVNKIDRGRQRLAWTVLLGSFTICMAITIAIPLLANAYLQNSTEFLAVVVQANQGTVSINDAGDMQQAVLAGQPGRTIEPGSAILTDATATALMSIYSPDNEQLLARMQVYGNSIVTVEQANTPRFKISDAGQVLRLDLAGGRLQLSVPEFGERSLIAIIRTPQGAVTIGQPGQYSLVVNNEETQVTVQNGLARVSGMEQFVDLVTDQRSVIPTGSIPSVPLGTERNLVSNGDFNDSWAKWQQYAWEIERGDQPSGQIDVVDRNNEPVLYVARQGEGHADVKVRQTIGQDVNDFESLQLQLTFRIVWQSLGVCGVQGSECPLFVRINYVDQTGTNRTWQHGFYAVGEVAETTPDICIFCSVVQSPHNLVTMGQVQFYDIDFLEELARQGVPPASFLESIELVVSGHGFEVEIVEVALLTEG